MAAAVTSFGNDHISTLSIVVATLPGAGSKGDKLTGRLSKQTLTLHLSACPVLVYANTHTHARAHITDTCTYTRGSTPMLCSFLPSVWSYTQCFMFCHLSLFSLLCFELFRLCTNITFPIINKDNLCPRFDSSSFLIT